MNEQKPLLVVIAGPLGAGKTTFYEAYLREAFPTLVPPVPHQREAMLREHRSFAVEDLVVDTELLENARDAGYATRVIFISTEDPKSQCRAHSDQDDSWRAIGAAEHNSRVIRRIREELTGGSQARRRCACVRQYAGWKGTPARCPLHCRRTSQDNAFLSGLVEAFLRSGITRSGLAARMTPAHRAQIT